MQVVFLLAFLCDELPNIHRVAMPTCKHYTARRTAAWDGGLSIPGYRWLLVNEGSRLAHSLWSGDNEFSGLSLSSPTCIALLRNGECCCAAVEIRRTTAESILSGVIIVTFILKRSMFVCCVYLSVVCWSSQRSSYHREIDQGLIWIIAKLRHTSKVDPHIKSRLGTLTGH